MRRIFAYLMLPFIIQNLYSQSLYFDSSKAYKYLKEIVSEFGPRTMGSPAEQKALKYVVEKFKRFGCDTAYIMPMKSVSTFNTNSGIAIGVKKGKTGKIIIIGGHIDTAGPEIPGANDNASGSALVLALAEVLTKHEFNSTILFALFGGEETGLSGSKYFVENFSEIDSVFLMLNLDMVDGSGNIEIDPHGYKDNSPKWLVKAVMEEVSRLSLKNIVYSVNAQAINTAFLHGASSDHESFINAGIPAIDFTSDLNYPLHTPQDNLKNFNPSALQNIGNLIINLILKFDSGIPDKKTEEYWMILIGYYPFFISLYGLKIFVSSSLMISIIAIFVMRKRRVIIANFPIIGIESDSVTSKPRKWSGIKVLLLTFVLGTSVIMALQLISLIKAERIPWYGDFTPYYFYTFLFFIAGLWIALNIAKRWLLSKCPYFFFKRTIFILIFLTIILLILSVKLAIYPALSLLLISLAGIIKKPFPKISLFLLSPIPVFSLIFNEWFTFGLRMYHISSLEVPSTHLSLTINLFFIAFFTFLFLPFALYFGSLYRESNIVRTIISKFLEIKLFTGNTAAIVFMSLYLYSLPSYNELWQKEVEVKQIFNFDSKQFMIDIRSFEYLDSINIRYDGIDTSLFGRDLHLIFHKSDSLPLDTRKYKISREIKKQISNDTTFFEANLILNLKEPVYRIALTYSGKEYILKSLYTPYNFVNDRGKIKIKFFSYPNMPLKIPLQFFTINNDTLKEEIKIEYADWLKPMEFKRPLTNFIKRSEIQESWQYYLAENLNDKRK